MIITSHRILNKAGIGFAYCSYVACFVCYQSLLLHRRLNVIQVVLDGASNHAFEQEHWQRLQMRDDSLRLGLVGARQRHAVVARRKSQGSDEDESTVFSFSLVVFVRG